MLFDPKKYRVVDLSPEVVAKVTTEDGRVMEGKPDPLGVGFSAKQVTQKVPDYTRYTLMTMLPHVGSHVEMGKGHIDHFPGFEKQTGLWELPITNFFGEASVINLSFLKARPKQNEDDKSFRGQPIQPEHLANVKKGDIVLMWSPFPILESPYLPPKTCEWLKDKGIKGIAFQLPGVMFDDYQVSSTHKIFLTNNITITYPLTNVDKLKKDRVFYFQLPMKFVNIEASCVRAIAFEEI